MRLKHYQEKVIKALKDYLSELSEFKAKYQKALTFDVDMASDYNFPKRAWGKYVAGSSPSGRLGGAYHSKTNSLNEPLPDIYLKVPTEAMVKLYWLAIVLT
jgi:type III restriction enzyme